jgi:protocatechuate 3,4-dioxygenase beta subunit
VRDTSDAAIPGARLTITNTATGLARSLLSDGNGGYLFTSLPPGEYRVDARQAGFRPESF